MLIFRKVIIHTLLISVITVSSEFSNVMYSVHRKWSLAKYFLEYEFCHNSFGKILFIKLIELIDIRMCILDYCTRIYEYIYCLFALIFLLVID